MESEKEDLGGRPPKFENAEELQKAIDNYFDFLLRDEAATISGLCYYLGFESRQSFYDYEQRDGFSYTIKRARLRIESIYEGRLQGNNCTGSIFALKNFGWVDAVDHTSGGKEIKSFNLTVKPDTE